MNLFLRGSLLIANVCAAPPTGAQVAGVVQGPFLPRPVGTRRDEEFKQLSLFERRESDVGLSPVAHVKTVLEVGLIYSGLTVQYSGLHVVSLA